MQLKACDPSPSAGRVASPAADLAANVAYVTPKAAIPYLALTFRQPKSRIPWWTIILHPRLLCRRLETAPFGMERLMEILSLIIQIISGAVGGTAAGNASPNLNLGPLGNAIAGAVGGGVGGQILSALLGLAASRSGGLDIAG